jgi:hypothetical protein
MNNVNNTELDAMRSAIVSIIQKALMLKDETPNSSHYKDQITDLLKKDIDNFLKDFIIFNQRY